jgi:hypothetical protein
VAELVSVDLVSRPAANPDGVFRAGSEPEAAPKVDTALDDMPMHPEKKEDEFDAKAAFEALSATVSELAEAVKAMQPDEEKDEKPEVDSEMAAKLEAVTSKLSALEVELAARGDNAISGNGSAVSVEEAYAAGDRATKFEIVRKALEARDFSLISKLKNNK